jgi:hypothetical protein
VPSAVAAWAAKDGPDEVLKFDEAHVTRTLLMSVYRTGVYDQPPKVVLLHDEEEN